MLLISCLSVTLPQLSLPPARRISRNLHNNSILKVAVTLFIAVSDDFTPNVTLIINLLSVFCKEIVRKQYFLLWNNHKLFSFENGSVSRVLPNLYEKCKLQLSLISCLFRLYHVVYIYPALKFRVGTQCSILPGTCSCDLSKRFRSKMKDRRSVHLN